MFQRAVQNHATSENVKKPVDGAPVATSNTPVPLSTPSSHWQRSPQRVIPPLGRAKLFPATASGLNSLNTRAIPAPSAVKRTYSGLAKALGDNGDDGFKENHAVVHANNAQGESAMLEPDALTRDSVIVFDDDFDSDVDIGVENSTSQRSIAHPKLGPAYPTLSQRAHFHTNATPFSGYGASLPRVEGTSPGTPPLPWSSSPDSHFEPPARLGQLVNFQYSDHPEANMRFRRDTRELASKPVSEPGLRPPKRKTLPWLEDHDKELEPLSHQDATAAKSTAQRTGTPMQQPAVSSRYLWNATASAVKERQKQFRKANKKPVKAELATSDETPIKINAATKRAKGVSRPHLSQEQRHILDLVVEGGKSIFFTGSAGTGKSVLLREIITIMRKKHQRESDRVAITASTGLAACNIGGVTLHSFAGIGLGKEEVPELVKKIKRNQKAKHRWMRTKVLVIDEVSMVDGELFDKLESIARQIRNNGRPFGGIQLVITGDFFQLPPVPDHGKGLATFAFEAGSWNTAIDHTIGLHHVFRQRDPVFANMLNEMREGRLSEDSIKTFRNLSRPILVKDDDGDCEATELFPTRAEVDAANNSRMRQLSGETMMFEAKDGGAVVDKTARDKLLSNCMAPQELTLKKGAQVMLIKNIDENLVNGSLGKVLGFMNEELFSSYNADPDHFSETIQGEDASDNLDRQSQLNKLKYAAFKSNTSQCWPVVRFVNADGTTRDLLCNREVWKVELPNGEVQASRTQVPLILAWALSIHKAQGQTLEKVKVDLGRVFEKGQAYVALSRATSIDGLQVLRFDPTKVMAHDRVRNFYSKLSSVAGVGRTHEAD